MEKQKVVISEADKKINELKIEMLKQNQKRKGIKREIARALTMKKNQNKTETETKSGGKK